MRRLVVGAAGWLAIASGCAPAESVRVATERDSAGIRIVEHAAGFAELPTWSVAEPPEASIGARDETDPAYQFAEIRGAVRLSDGRVVVGDWGSREARYFDAEGRHLRTVGGLGEGPGEMRNLFAVDRIPGDTLVVGGWPIGSRYWFDERGDFIRKQALGPWLPGLVGRTLLDGSLLLDSYPRGSYGNMIESFAVSGAESDIRPVGVLEVVSREGERSDTLGPIAGENVHKVGEWPVTLAVHGLPFSPIGLVTWSVGEVHVGHTERPEVVTYAFDGTIRRIVRWSYDPVPVTAEDRRRFDEEVLADVVDPDRVPNARRLLADMASPEVKPAFAALIAEDDGTLWVQDSPRSGDARDRWTVFGPDGVAIARAEVPVGLDVLDVDRTQVLARRTDEVGVESLRSYRIVRSR